MEIDLHGDMPAYLQLADLIRAGIEAGTYLPRHPVPSITQLTGLTGLAVGTVRKAIEVLKREGLIYAVSGRGTFVTPPEQRAERAARYAGD